MSGNSQLYDDEVRLPAGPRLALRRGGGDDDRRPFLLVHGLSSNARLWDGTAARLVAAGHQVVAVDQRGHGRSEQVADGYTTPQCAADLAALCLELGLVGDRAPVVAGQSWGGNVVLHLAAEHGGVAAAAFVDGGFIWLGARFPTFEQCWAELAPPVMGGTSYRDLAERFRGVFAGFPPEGVEAQIANLAEVDGQARPRLTREHHREILRSMWEIDPRPLFGKVDVPSLLAVAVPADGTDPRDGLRIAEEQLPDVVVARYVGAHHDLHAQQPDRMAADLLALAERAEAVAP
jgi:pimeloyl-ACP methyl ester carboxylesterase